MPRLAIGALANLGHQVEFAKDIGLSNDFDMVIAAHAQTTQAALVTRDLDFADVRNYPPEEYFGIVVVRVPDEALALDIANLLKRFAGNPEFTDNLSGKLAIVEENRVRFRPPLS
jgi:predicted nuclease of predicted toxin-antitoxin system